ncbi:MAG: hypothetical protein ACRETZ_10145 [Steroidobacteraceae bacterium]
MVASYTCARAILTDHFDALHALAAARLRLETPDAAQIHAISRRRGAARGKAHGMALHAADCFGTKMRGVFPMANVSDCGHAVS